MPEKPDEEQSAANYNDEPTSQNNPSAVEQKADEEAENAKKKEHRRAERRHWTFEKIFGGVALVLTAFAAIGAIASSFAAFRALEAVTRSADEARRQANAAFADQRPWLRIDLNLVGLRFTPNLDAEVSYETQTKNVGRSPAKNIQSRIQGSVVVKDSAINSIPDQKRQCDLAQKDAEQARWPGAFIFAGDVGSGTLGIAGIGRAYVTHDTFPAAWPTSDNLELQIVGCFDYTLPSDEHGQTGFTYRLAKKIPNSDHVSGFTPKPGVISLQDILFQRDPFSGGYFQ